MKTKTTRTRTRQGVRVRKTIAVNKPPDEVYAFWREIENFPRFMDAVESVERLDASTSRWRVKGPAGTAVEWTAEMTEDPAERRISWKTVGDTASPNGGSVFFRFGPRGEGTALTVDLTYDPPAGRAGEWAALLGGREPSQQLSRDLRRLKALLETGEVPTNAVSEAGTLALAGGRP